MFKVTTNTESLNHQFNPNQKNVEKHVLGWREWVCLSDFDNVLMNAKIDTGTRTSCLHTYHLESFNQDNQLWAKFTFQATPKHIAAREFTAQIVDLREVIDSSGNKTERYVVETELEMGNAIYPIELTLTQTKSMKFRLHLGRTAFQGRYVIDPNLSFQLGGTSETPPEYED